MAKNPPTVRMRRLGAQLRKLREQRGLNLDDAAAMLNMSKSALNRMENAQVTVRPYEVTYLLMVYEVTDQDLHDSLIGLAAAGRSKDWVRLYGTLSPGPVVGDFVRLEQDSVAIRTFQSTVIPGLLQTPQYVRAVMEAVPLYPGRDVDRSVAFRMARQEVLTRPNPARVHAVIAEGALRQLMGGVEVMHAQLRHLLEMAQQVSIDMQILPFTATRNPGFDGPFTLLDVETGDFTVAVIESLDRSVFLEDDADVRRFRRVFEDLCDEALPESESLALVERVLHELKTP